MAITDSDITDPYLLRPQQERQHAPCCEKAAAAADLTGGPWAWPEAWLKPSRELQGDSGQVATEHRRL